MGTTKTKKIEHKLERLVYVASLVFDPRVANVWSSDMLDALITSVMVSFSTAIASSKRLEKMEKVADKAKGTSTVQRINDPSKVCCGRPGC